MRRSWFGSCSRRGSDEHAEVAADRKIRSTADNQDSADAGVLGDLGRRLGEIGGHIGIDRVALLRTVKAQGRDAIGNIQQHRPQGAGGLTPTRRIGVLLKSPEASLVNRDEMCKVSVEHSAGLLAPAAVASRHQQAAIGQIDKSLRFGARVEMPGDRAPGVAAHRAGTVVITANAKRHALGSTAGEFRVEYFIQLSTVAGSERRVEGAGQICSVAVFHPLIPFPGSF